MRMLGDGRYVLHFHGDRARTLAPHRPRVRAKLRADLGSGRRRIISNFNSKPAKNSIGELAVGAVDVLRKQNMVAAFKQREMNQRDCSLSSGSNDGAEPFLQLTNLGREFKDSRRPVQPVGITKFVLVPFVGGRGRVRKQYR